MKRRSREVRRGGSEEGEQGAPSKVQDLPPFQLTAAEGTNGGCRPLHSATPSTPTPPCKLLAPVAPDPQPNTLPHPHPYPASAGAAQRRHRGEGAQPAQRVPQQCGQRDWVLPGPEGGGEGELGGGRGGGAEGGLPCCRQGRRGSVSDAYFPDPGVEVSGPQGGGVRTQGWRCPDPGVGVSGPRGGVSCLAHPWVACVLRQCPLRPSDGVLCPPPPLAPRLQVNGEDSMEAVFAAVSSAIEAARDKKAAKTPAVA